MKKIIAALISLTLFYSSTVCIFAIENQECPYYEEITDESSVIKNSASD